MAKSHKTNSQDTEDRGFESLSSHSHNPAHGAGLETAAAEGRQKQALAAQFLHNCARGMSKGAAVRTTAEVVGRGLVQVADELHRLGLLTKDQHRFALVVETDIRAVCAVVANSIDRKEEVERRTQEMPVVAHEAPVVGAFVELWDELLGWSAPVRVTQSADGTACVRANLKFLVLAAPGLDTHGGRIVPWEWRYAPCGECGARVAQCEDCKPEQSEVPEGRDGFAALYPELGCLHFAHDTEATVSHLAKVLRKEGKDAEATRIMERYAVLETEVLRWWDKVAPPTVAIVHLEEAARRFFLANMAYVLNVLPKHIVQQAAVGYARAADKVSHESGGGIVRAFFNARQDIMAIIAFPQMTATVEEAAVLS